LFLPSAALGKGLIRRVPDEMLSAKIFALGKGAVSGSALYCGRMTSTQRSESVNKMINSSGFTGHMTCLSKFAGRMLDFIQRTNHTAAGETHWSQVIMKAIFYLNYC
jgi:hypothetical protein